MNARPKFNTNTAKYTNSQNYEFVECQAVATILSWKQHLIPAHSIKLWVTSNCHLPWRAVLYLIKI